MRQGKLMLIGTGRGDSDMDPAHADLYQRAELQQFQPDAAATGLGELGEGQANPTQRTEQHVGKRGEPQAQLIGPHGGGRGAVCEQVQLAFLDTVLHLAAGAVDPLVQPSGVDFGRCQHCFGSLRAPFEEYQRVTNFISEKQNADGVYGNEKTAKAVFDVLDPVVDQQINDWIVRSCRSQNLYNLGLGLFEDQADATLFRIFWA